MSIPILGAPQHVAEGEKTPGGYRPTGAVLQISAGVQTLPDIPIRLLGLSYVPEEATEEEVARLKSRTQLVIPQPPPQKDVQFAVLTMTRLALYLWAITPAASEDAPQTAGGSDAGVDPS